MSSTVSQPAVKTGIQFTETMRGYFAKGESGDFQAAADKAKQENSPFEFTLTVATNDLDDMLNNSQHPAQMNGTVSAPVLSDKPLSVQDGVFQLFVQNPTGADTRNMNYRMTMTAADGHKWFFTGFKVVHPNPAADIWHDTSTLYITVYDGTDEKAPIFGKGVLHILPADFAKQMTTLKVTNATSPVDALRQMARFGHFFGGVLFDVYGGVFAQPTVFDPNAPPREKRPLRVDAPTVHTFPAKDGVALRLTRYRGGSKGPVILSHGLGVSSLIFSIDTIDTNLLEFLFGKGYDVWLLDFRDSIALPASSSEWSGDDVAKNDYPAAVDYVRNATGAKDVQMVVHCWGSTTFFISMLAGLQGVRSVVASQIATHFVVPTMNKIRTGLHLPEFLDRIGIKSLTAYVDSRADWWNRVYDDGLRLYPVPLDNLCNNPVCHRITFMYALLYEHAQLNQATHENGLREMFGIANIKSFEQISLMTRKGHIVAADGSEDYLPHLDRLKVPIVFIHGGNNACFHPESTQITYDILCKANGTALYSRHVVPNYGHIDCIYGKNAAVDVYPLMLDHLEQTANVH